MEKKKGTFDIDMDQVETDRQEAELSSENIIPFWKPKEGDNLIRVLPPISGEAVPYHKVFLHYNLELIPVTCPGKKDCPACEYVSRKEDRNHPIRGTKKIFFNIIDRDNEEVGVQIFSAGNTFFKDFADHLLDPDWGPEIVDPEEGTDILIERTGTGLNTTYSNRFRRKSSPIAETEEEIQEILENRIDLSTVAPTTSIARIEELVEIYAQKEDGNVAGLAKAEKAEARKQSRRSQKTKVKEEEKEEEEKEEEEEEKEKEEEEKEEEEEEKEEEEEEKEEKTKKNDTRKPRKKAKTETKETEEEAEDGLEDLLKELTEEEF